MYIYEYIYIYIYIYSNPKPKAGGMAKMSPGRVLVEAIYGSVSSFIHTFVSDCNHLLASHV